MNPNPIIFKREAPKPDAQPNPQDYHCHTHHRTCDFLHATEGPMCNPTLPLGPESCRVSQHRHLTTGMPYTPTYDPALNVGETIIPGYPRTTGETTWVENPNWVTPDGSVWQTPQRPQSAQDRYIAEVARSMQQDQLARDRRRAELQAMVNRENQMIREAQNYMERDARQWVPPQGPFTTTMDFGTAMGAQQEAIDQQNTEAQPPRTHVDDTPF